MEATLDATLEELKANLSKINTLPDFIEKGLERSRLIDSMAMLEPPTVKTLCDVLQVGKSTVYGWNLPMDWASVYSFIKRHYPKRFPKLEKYIFDTAREKRQWYEARI